MFSLLFAKKKKKTQPKQLLQQTNPIPASSGVSCHQPPSHQESWKKKTSTATSSKFIFQWNNCSKARIGAQQNQLGWRFTPSCLLGGDLPVPATARGISFPHSLRGVCAREGQPPKVRF